MAFLAIDYGKKRIGLAVGSIFPKGAGVIDGAKPIEKITEEIAQICEKEDILKIIIGLPIRSQGEEGQIAQDARELGTALAEKTGLEIVYEPEQYTSASAAEILGESEKKYSRESGKLDEMAAILILEQYVNGQKEELA